MLLIYVLIRNKWDKESQKTLIDALIHFYLGLFSEFVELLKKNL